MYRQLYSFLLTVVVIGLSACGTQYYSGSTEGYSRVILSSCSQQVHEGLPETARLNVPYISQSYNHCGPASLSMVMGFYGVGATQEELADGIMGAKGVNTRDLAIKAEDYGFAANVVSCSLSGMLSIVSEGTPVVVRVINASGSNGHFIVVTGYDMDLGLVYVNDPERPYNEFYIFEEFNELWEITSLGSENSSRLTMVFYPQALI